MKLLGKDINLCHTHPVGHGTVRHDDETAWQRNHSHPVKGWEMNDKTAWQSNKPVLRTACWSWEEAWLMRLPCKEIKQWHSHSVGHGMSDDWWNCLVTHSLLVIGWDMIDEIAWCPSHSLSVGHGMRLHDWWNCLVCDLLSVGHGIETWLLWLPGKTIKQCHSQPVGHGMRHNATVSCEWMCCPNSPPFGHIRHDETAWQTQNSVDCSQPGIL